MKKIFVLITAAALVLSMASCSKKEETKKQPDKAATTVTPGEIVPEESVASAAVKEKVATFLANVPESEKNPVKEETEKDTTPIEGIEIPYQFDLTPYITIEAADYTGLELTAMSTEVTAEDMEEAILLDLENYGTESEVTDRAAELGDTVNIDFEGIKDGVAFEGGTAAGYDLVLGSGSFIPGFEEQLVGHKVGESFTIDVTFPENYDSADLAGQAVQFNIKINAIKSTSVPELADEFVKTNFYCETVDDYLLQKYREVYKNNLIEVENAAKSLAYSLVYENVTINSLPEEAFNYYCDKINTDNEEMAKAYGMTLDELLEASGMTKEDFEQYTVDQATAIVEQELVAFAIAKNEGLLEGLTRGDFDAYVNMIADSYGYKADEFKAQYGEDMLYNSLVLETAIQFVIANATTK